jgi:hypothetical protein
MQNRALAHVTAFIDDHCAPCGNGIDPTLQRRPSHRSENAEKRPCGFTNAPTARHDDGPLHVTPLNPANGPPGFGLAAGTARHRPSTRCSISGDW